MRPKKRILLIDVNETRRGVTCFTLQTALWCKVRGAGSEAEARAIAHDWTPDGVLVMLPAPGILVGALLDELHCKYPTINGSVAVTDRPGASPESVCATMSLVRPSMMELVERMKLLTARKRGPQKGIKKPVQSVAPAELAERVRA